MASVSFLVRARLLLGALIVSALGVSHLRAAPVDPNNYSGPVKVACIGDSITWGVGADPGKSFPDQLQALLGPKWIVKNFGVSARTLLRKGDIPWWNDKAFTDSHALKPDVVVIMLGTNDTKPQNWVHRADFYGDYRDLIESYKALPEASPYFHLPSHPHSRAGQLRNQRDQSPVLYDADRPTGPGRAGK